jgi:hypothetical protein
MTSQSSTRGTEPHVVDRLAEYFGGSLATADELTVEAHLLFCAECRAEYDELGTVALGIALQSLETLDDVAAPAGAHGSAAGPMPTQPSRGSSGPGRGSGTGPAGRSRRSRLRRLAGYTMALVVGAAIGIGAMALADRAETPPMQTVGDGQDISTDRLSVTVVEADGQTRIQAAAVGVRPGRGFQLVAVGTDGQGYLVTTGVAEGGLLSAVGTVPIPASRIAFVALVEDGGGAVLVARPS